LKNEHGETFRVQPRWLSAADVSQSGEEASTSVREAFEFRLVAGVFQREKSAGIGLDAMKILFIEKIQDLALHLYADWSVWLTRI
jgi:hypothetical protein